jgi:Aminoglycoside adenylyltransferase, C-terminal domain
MFPIFSYQLCRRCTETFFELSSAWAQHLEGSYIPTAALKHLPPPTRNFWYLDNGSKELVRSDHDDSLVVYWVLRERGISMSGPDPRSLVSPVSADALRREISDTMRTWLEDWKANPSKLNNRFYQPFAVLSYCRMLHSLQVGTVESKPAGAAWAKEALDSRWRELIQRALDSRPGDPAEKVCQSADTDALESTWKFMEYAAELGSSL